MLQIRLPTEENFRIAPINVCALYLMIKLHMSGKYDVIKYNWKYGISQASFNARRDKKFFEGVAYKYTLHELTHLFVSSFLMNGSDWIGGITSEQAGINYRKYTTLLKMYSKEFNKEMELILLLREREKVSLVEMFTYDDKKDTSRIFNMLKLGMIKYETFLILDRLFGLIDAYDKVSENYEWMNYSTILKAYRKLLIIDNKMAVDILCERVYNKMDVALNKEKILLKAELNGEKTL